MNFVPIEVKAYVATPAGTTRRWYSTTLMHFESRFLIFLFNYRHNAANFNSLIRDLHHPYSLFLNLQLYRLKIILRRNQVPDEEGILLPAISR